MRQARSVACHPGRPVAIGDLASRDSLPRHLFVRRHAGGAVDMTAVIARRTVLRLDVQRKKLHHPLSVDVLDGVGDHDLRHVDSLRDE
jgi:hypothetical protein